MGDCFGSPFSHSHGSPPISTRSPCGLRRSQRHLQNKIQNLPVEPALWADPNSTKKKRYICLVVGAESLALSPSSFFFSSSIGLSNCICFDKSPHWLPFVGVMATFCRGERLYRLPFVGVTLRIGDILCVPYFSGWLRARANQVTKGPQHDQIHHRQAQQRRDD